MKHIPLSRFTRKGRLAIWYLLGFLSALLLILIFLKILGLHIS